MGIYTTVYLHNGEIIQLDHAELNFDKCDDYIEIDYEISRLDKRCGFIDKDEIMACLQTQKLEFKYIDGPCFLTEVLYDNDGIITNMLTLPIEVACAAF